MNHSLTYESRLRARHRKAVLSNLKPEDLQYLRLREDQIIPMGMSINLTFNDTGEEPVKTVISEKKFLDKSLGGPRKMKIMDYLLGHSIMKDYTPHVLRRRGIELTEFDKTMERPLITLAYYITRFSKEKEMCYETVRSTVKRILNIIIREVKSLQKDLINRENFNTDEPDLLLLTNRLEKLLPKEVIQRFLNMRKKTSFYDILFSRDRLKDNIKFSFDEKLQVLNMFKGNEEMLKIQRLSLMVAEGDEYSYVLPPEYRKIQKEYMARDSENNYSGRVRILFKVMNRRWGRRDSKVVLPIKDKIRKNKDLNYEFLSEIMTLYNFTFEDVNLDETSNYFECLKEQVMKAYRSIRVPKFRDWRLRIERINTEFPSFQLDKKEYARIFEQELTTQERDKLISVLTLFPREIRTSLINSITGLIFRSKFDLIDTFDEWYRESEEIT